MQQILIGGAWLDPGEGTVREIHNPATLRPLASVRDCRATDVARAVAAARSALPQWQALAPAARAALLADVAVRMRALKPETAALATRENGVPLCESLDCIEAAALMFECWSAAADGGERAQPAATGVLLPAHFTLLALGAAAAPALTLGATLVVQPPAGNPLSSLALARAFAGLPAGVVNAVTGDAVTARALAEHVACARFEESAAADSAAADAFIVCRDADLDVAVPGIAWERLRHGGQLFASARHIFVERPIAEEFVERMHQCVGFLDVDDPAKRPTDLGPLISLEAARQVEDQVGRVLRGGARLILGGRRFRPSGLAGHFFQPTLLVLREGAAVPEAIAGPVITISSVRDPAEGWRLAREAGRGSGASIYTRDVKAASALARASVGTLRINDPALPGAAGPFSGIRHPAIRAAFAPSRQAHAVTIEAAATLQRKPWWFPYADRPLG